MEKKYLLLVLLVLPMLLLRAQLETAHWYFGNGAGLNFTTGTPTVDDEGSLITDEGCSSISDKDGQLLFYTDGITVYNRNHLIMTNGSNLEGDTSSSQSGIIVPNPYDSNLYYIFTVDANDSNPSLIRGLHYTVVDMSLNSGYGEVLAIQKNIPLPLGGVQRSSEKVTAVKHANGKDIWVITHYLDSFYAFLVNNTGVVLTPIVSKVGVNIPFQVKDKIVYPNNGRGYIKASPDGTKIAIAHLSAIQESDYDLLPSVYIPNCGAVYGSGGILAIYNFDNSTGVVSKETILQTKEKGNKAFYGIEFSSNSKVLYAEYDAFKGESKTCSYAQLNNWTESKVIQYDLISSDIPATEFVVYNFPNLDNDFNKARGALQLGLDKKIYYTQYDRSYLSVINNPNNLGSSSDFKYDDIYLAESGSTRYGLPPFITSFFDGKILVNGSVDISDACKGDFLMLSVDTDVENYTIDWDFGDGITLINSKTPAHLYNTPGTYVVKAIIHYLDSNNNKRKLDLSKTITINPKPVVNLGLDIVTCESSYTLDGGSYPLGTTYLWSTGETTQTINVNTTGNYTLTVTTPKGCPSLDDIQVTFNPNPVVNLGNDILTCESSYTLDGGSYPLGTTYLWSNGATTQTINVNTPGTYTLTVTSPQGCSGSDDVKVTFNSKPAVNLGSDITVCEGTAITLGGGT